MTSIMIGDMGISVLGRVDDAPALVEELTEVFERLGHVQRRALERDRVGERRPPRFRLGAPPAQRVEQAQIEGVELLERLLVDLVEIEEAGVATAGELDGAAEALEASREPIEDGQAREGPGLGEPGLVLLEEQGEAGHLPDEAHAA